MSDGSVPKAVKRGLDVGVYLHAGVTDPDSIANALGNLAAFELGAEREELLVARVFRVNAGRSRHYRLALRHPGHRLSFGLSRAVVRKLRELSSEPEDRLSRRYAAAQEKGLRPAGLSEIAEETDFWQDDLWTALGGPASIGLAPESG